jgi:hypothetical protein
MEKDLWGAVALPNKIKIGLPNYQQQKKKKRKHLTPAERIYVWEHPKMYGRTCHICHQRITKMSDLELDHRKAFSKGGTKFFLAHRECNRMKGNKSLAYVQKRLGIKSGTKKPRARRKKKRIAHEIFYGLDRRLPTIRDLLGD